MFTRLTIVILLMWATTQASADVDHTDKVQSYDGPQTCVTSKCHEEEAREVHSTIHWTGQGIPNKALPMGGSWGTKNPSKWEGVLNNFCIQPFHAGTDSQDEVMNIACSKCHISDASVVPSRESTPEQINAVDCMTCHHEEWFPRVAVPQEDGSIRFVPDATPEKILSMAQHPQSSPSNKACLNCHAGAGGVNAIKHMMPKECGEDPVDENCDVHSKAGVTCVKCHSIDNHRFRGTGPVILADDRLPNEDPLSCESCHEEQKHDGNEKIDDHTTFLDCTVCHVPFAGVVVPTGVARDFTTPHWTGTAWHPTSTLESNVMPVYLRRDKNATSLHLPPGVPPVIRKDGAVVLSMPDQTVEDTKWYPFKPHDTNHPVSVDGKPMVVHMDPYFTGEEDIYGALNEATQFIAEHADGIIGKYETFAKTRMYLGMSHEVTAEGLKCEACHTDGERRNAFIDAGLEPAIFGNSD